MFRLTHDGDVARLTLDRPEARNAIPARGWAELVGLLAGLEARLLVVAGAGGAFCAGADLDDFAAIAGEEAAAARFRADMRAALDALGALPFPTVARIEGACFGAGVALAIACDLRVAAPSARFAITPARIGFSYPQEDVHRLVALVGPGQAARLLLTAATIDGAEALAIGLAELAALDEAAILANHAASLAALKRGIGLAAAGARADAGQDRCFDALLAGDAAARRLEALRRK